MNLIFVLAMMGSDGALAPVAQFKDRPACMAQASLLKEQNVQAVCYPQQVLTEKEAAAQLNKVMGVFQEFMSAMK